MSGRSNSLFPIHRNQEEKFKNGGKADGELSIQSYSKSMIAGVNLNAKLYIISSFILFLVIKLNIYLILLIQYLLIHYAVTIGSTSSATI